MCLWSVALKARKAAKWPRTFYMVWTVHLSICYTFFHYQEPAKKKVHIGTLKLLFYRRKR